MSDNEQGSSCGRERDQCECQVHDSLQQLQTTVESLQQELPEMARHVRNTRRGQKIVREEITSILSALRDLIQTSQDLHTVVHGKDGGPSIRERLHSLETVQSQLLQMMQQAFRHAVKITENGDDHPFELKLSRKNLGKVAIAVGGWLVGLIAGIIQYYTVPR